MWSEDTAIGDVATMRGTADCFVRRADTAKSAITLTVPCLLAGERLFCVVPGKVKAPALKRALNDPIGPDCPATALRRHAHCTLYCDKDALPEG